MSEYEALKFLHVLAVVVWVGSGFFLQVLATRAGRSGDPRRMHELTRDAAWAGQRLFMPASIVALVFGILLVVRGPWSFSQAWIGVGIAGYVVSSVVGMAVLGPRFKKLEALAGERGPDAPEVLTASRSLHTIMRIDLVVLIAMVADMVIKPGT